MNNDEFSKPLLIEPGMRYFLHHTLKQCHTIKEQFNNTIFNVGLFILFCFVLGLILLYKYKGKLSPQELAIKNRQKQQYILSKITNFQEAKKKTHQELITGLPSWETDRDILHNV
jgi:hypothetical protein